jgi:hypothetical protein
MRQQALQARDGTEVAFDAIGTTSMPASGNAEDRGWH